MGDYFNLMMQQLGIPASMMIVMILILVWSAIWKLFALWKAGRNNSPVWFIVLALFNTMGILEILYLFVFSKMKMKPRARNHRRKRR
jgi:hypothetical protein